MAADPDPIAEGLARLQTLRTRLPDETQRALEAANSDRNPDPADLDEGEQYFAPEDLGFAIVHGAKEDRPDTSDGLSYAVAVVDGAARSAVIDVFVSRSAAQALGVDHLDAFVVERLRSRAGSIPSSEDRFGVLLGLHPLDL